MDPDVLAPLPSVLDNVGLGGVGYLEADVIGDEGGEGFVVGCGGEVEGGGEGG